MEYIVDQKDRLDKFLARMLPEYSRTRLSKIVDSGLVLVDGAAQKPSFSLQPGMAVALEDPGPSEVHDLTPADIPLEILFEDESLLVVNKPRGLAAHPAASLKEPSLVNALLARNTSLSQTAGSFRPGIVHRLDKETTGLMVVAKTDRAHVILAKQMETKTAERRYFAVVAGDIEQEHFKVDGPIARNKNNRLLMAIDPAGKHALTYIKRIARLTQGVLVGARLETGRTHQIRVHLRAVGHPILGDKVYAPREFGSGPMQLHAAYLAFDHPLSGERIAVYADPDESFYGRALVKREHLEDF